MLRNSRVKRTIAIFLLLNTTLYIFSPLAAYASLTAGPTAPEYTSFEPVDTTDMVNLATGDFTYNIPLLEVPGPEGGYPLSLSYHAGIMPNEEASWVGLGWTLNPGAINRTVNGYPDDQLGAIRTRRDYWAGGTRHTFSVGLGLPGVGNFGLSVSNDTNLGFGLGMSFNVGPDLALGGAESGLGISPSFGIASDGYSNVGTSVGIDLLIGKQGTKTAKLQNSIGLSTNFNSISISGRSGAMSTGLNMSSKGLRPSASVAGFSASQSNSSAEKISTFSFGFQIPITNFLVLGYNYLRYFSDEKSDVLAVGPLHFSNGNFNSDEYALDSYVFGDEDFSVDKDPEKERGGSLPSYDAFNVNAQGLSGSMQPYVFENASLFRQNIANQQNDSEDLISYSNLISFVKPVNFRFNNDFSNKLTYTNNPLFVIDNADASLENHQKELFTDYFDDSQNHLEGSKHIEWFTNNEIEQGNAEVKGFINYPGVIRSWAGSRDDGTSSPPQINLIEDQIGGYMITNESGVSYHYALPSYVYEQYSKSFLTSDNGTFVEYKDYEPYASHWLLTAITGPDFVDRNENGYVDEDDWGYWVKFDYGLWSPNYQWANPIHGTHTDLEQKRETFSRGRKQIYYLNAVSTRSHIAIFEKEIRSDGKGVSDFGENGVNNLGVNQQIYVYEDPITYELYPSVTYLKYPTSSLKLNRVMLFDKESMTEQEMLSLKDDSDTYDNVFSFDAEPSPIVQVVHQGNNVIDKFDIAANPNLIDRSLRVIELVHDYTLADRTTNSFDLAYSLTSSTTAQNSTKGKLTLKKIKMLGKGGVAVVPPIDFEYAENPDFDEDAVDIWGMYKSDFTAAISFSDRNIKNSVTPSSANDKAAWSLSTINTSMGASLNVAYESDDYSKVAIENFPSLQIKGLERQQYSTNEFILELNEVPGNLNELRGVGNTGEFVLGYMMSRMNNSGTFLSGGDEPKVKRIMDIEILQVNSNSIRVRSNELNTLISTIEPISYDLNLGWRGLIGGNLFLNIEGFNKNGGGLRVKNIAIKSPDSEEINYTNYDYSVNNKSSGVTSYEPNRVDLIDFFNYASLLNGIQPQGKINFENAYVKEIGSKINNIIALSRELPSPGVIYGSVTVTESIKHGTADSLGLPGKKIYEFQVFEADMVQRTLDDENGRDFLIIEDSETVYLPHKQHWLEKCDYTGSEFNYTSSWSPPQGFSWDNVQCSAEERATVSFGAFTQMTRIISSRTITKYEPISIKNYSSQVGALKSITTYGANDVLLQKTENQYVDSRTDNGSSDEFENQGLITQVFNEKRTIKQDDNSFDSIIVFTRKDEYPHVQLGSTTTDYKKGITTTSRNLKFDKLTGEPLEVLSTDGYGNKYISTSVPAYHIAAYNPSGSVGMGPKIVNIQNKNMLSQNAASYTYKVQEDELGAYSNIGLVAAGVQTWGTSVDVLDDEQAIIAQPQIWRKHRSYSWVGEQVGNLNEDGLYPVTSFVDFDAWEPLQQPTSSLWQKNAEITLYDVYSHALEVTDINSQYAATKMDLGMMRVLSTAALAKYTEMAYSGAEDWAGDDFGGGIKRNAGVVLSATTNAAPTHTGDKSMGLTSGTKGFEFTSNDITEGTYRVSLWSSVANSVTIKYQVNGGSQTTVILLPEQQAGNWYLVRGNISVPANTTSFFVFVEGTATTYVDDFRFHPIESAMTSYVYNQWGELSHILDANNLFTEYEYDAAGRLKAIYRERLGPGRMKLSEQEMIYQKATN